MEQKDIYLSKSFFKMKIIILAKPDGKLVM